MERKEREKKVREEYILQIAERLFAEKGYYNTTTDEIAEAAEYTKRTLYRYFESKEDIYFALALRNFKELFNEVQTGFASEGNALEKISFAGKRYINFFLEKFDKYLILSRARHINTREEESIYHQGIVAVQQKMFGAFIHYVTTGQYDGSIRKDLNPMMAVHFMLSSLITLFGDVADNRRKMEKQLPYTIETFLNYALEMHIGILKNRT